MTDVLHYQTTDNGEMNVKDGIAEMTDGPETAVYHSLFGGNEDDAGGSDTTFEWWGNSLETEPARKYRSQTQYLLRSLPATPFNLGRVKTAVENDLAWMLEDEIFSEVTVSVGIPRLNWIQIRIDTNNGIYDYNIPWEVAA